MEPIGNPRTGIDAQDQVDRGIRLAIWLLTFDPLERNNFETRQAVA